MIQHIIIHVIEWSLQYYITKFNYILFLEKQILLNSHTKLFKIRIQSPQKISKSNNIDIIILVMIHRQSHIFFKDKTKLNI